MTKSAARLSQGYVAGFNGLSLTTVKKRPGFMYLLCVIKRVVLMCQIYRVIGSLGHATPPQNLMIISLSFSQCFINGYIMNFFFYEKKRGSFKTIWTLEISMNNKKDITEQLLFFIKFV